MGLYDSPSPEVRDLEGLHLYHFVMSNCSQRVRLALEEKGLEWESHHLNLPGREHLTEDYQRINPKGVVPTLVHDGVVVIESNDILAYLDDHFPSPPLRPGNLDERARMEERIDAASGAQATIKVLSHELLFRPFRKIGPADLALFEKEHRDKNLVEFMRDYSENGPAWRARFERAQSDLTAALDALDAALDTAPWLSGPNYGLADISWVVNGNRLNQAQVDLAKWPRFQDWTGRAMARPAFDKAVASYTP